MLILLMIKFFIILVVIKNIEDFYLYKYKDKWIKTGRLIINY